MRSSAAAAVVASRYSAGRTAAAAAATAAHSPSAVRGRCFQAGSLSSSSSRRLASSWTAASAPGARSPVFSGQSLPGLPLASGQRCAFHRTMSAGMPPRRRDFFTSSALLKSEDGGGNSTGKDDKARSSPFDRTGNSPNKADRVDSRASSSPQQQQQQLPQATLAKRKRAAGAKNSLRRVAAMAQQAPLARPAKGPGKNSSDAAAEDELEEYEVVEDLENDEPASARAISRATASKPFRPGRPNRRAAAAAAEESAARDVQEQEEEEAIDDGPRADGSNVISAVCLAESFDMQQVSAILQAEGYRLDPDGSGFESHEVVHGRRVWPREAVGGSHGSTFAVETPREVDLFVFESGTLVGWGLPEDAVDRLATERLVAAAQDPFVAARETETLEFRRDTGRDSSAMRGSDVIVLGVRAEAAAGDRLATTRAQIAFSSGLARSTKLAALERSFSDYFESTRRIPAMLAAGKGGARMLGSISQRFIVQKTGELLSLRAQLNHYRELTDALPDIFWDARAELGLESYYEQVGRALDVGVRIKTLNQKMDYAQEIATVLREISSEQHGTRLEWIVIVLIAVEVVFELRRVFLERHEEAPEPAGTVVEKLEHTTGARQATAQKEEGK